MSSDAYANYDRWTPEQLLNIAAQGNLVVRIEQDWCSACENKEGRAAYGEFCHWIAHTMNIPAGAVRFDGCEEACERVGINVEAFPTYAFINNGKVTTLTGIQTLAKLKAHATKVFGESGNEKHPGVIMAKPIIRDGRVFPEKDVEAIIYYKETEEESARQLARTLAEFKDLYNLSANARIQMVCTNCDPSLGHLRKHVSGAVLIQSKDGSNDWIPI